MDLQDLDLKRGEEDLTDLDLHYRVLFCPAAAALFRAPPRAPHAGEVPHDVARGQNPVPHQHHWDNHPDPLTPGVEMWI